MPEHIRALIVILVLSGPLWLGLQQQLAQYIGIQTARQWRNLWIIFTIVAFVAGDFWIYAALLTGTLLARRLKPAEALATYFLLLLLLPAAGRGVPGFGLVNYLFTLDHTRLLSLVLLGPAALALWQRRKAARSGRSAPDGFLAAYLAWVAALQLREATLTNTLRGCFYLLIDVGLPYYVASRALQTLEDFRRVALAFVTAAALQGGLAMFETLRHWNLYSAVIHALGLQWGYSGYLPRDGLLRASGSTGQPIILGYVMAVAGGLSFFALGTKRLRLRETLPQLAIAGGLLAALSRGPWVGAGAIVLTFVATGPRARQRVLSLLALAIAALGLATLLPGGQRLLDLLPFIGKVDEYNVIYRQRLFDNALAVVERHFWLGSVDYLQAPELQSMIQGQGIIDIVNSYLGVALEHGVLGLLLFGGFFVSVLLRVSRTQNTLAPGDEWRILGRALLACLVGVLLMIATVSSIVLIPLVYWSLAGVCVAYTTLMAKRRRAT